MGLPQSSDLSSSINCCLKNAEMQNLHHRCSGCKNRNKNFYLLFQREETDRSDFFIQIFSLPFLIFCINQDHWKNYLQMSYYKYQTHLSYAEPSSKCTSPSLFPPSLSGYSLSFAILFGAARGGSLVGLILILDIDWLGSLSTPLSSISPPSFSWGVASGSSPRA